MKPPVRQLWIPLLLLALLATAGLLASQFTSVEWFARNDGWLRTHISQRPVSSGLVAFVLYLVVSLIPGTAGKSILLGWLFGLFAGVVIVNSALVVAALVTFLTCRHYLKAAIQRRFGGYLRPIQERIRADGAMYLLMLRLAHAPFSLTNYATGAATEVPFCTFWWTTQIGLLPGNVIFVYAGTRLPTLRVLIDIGPVGLLDLPMILALAGSLLIPWLVRVLLQLRPSRSKTARELPDLRETSPIGKER